VSRTARAIERSSHDGRRTAAQPEIATSALRLFETRTSLGAAPKLTLIAAYGLLLVAVADNAARQGSGGSLKLLFWVGLALIYGPIAFRLFGGGAQRSERIVLALVLGLSLLLVKVLHSPAEFARFDELGWWRATRDVIASGHTFGGNPLNGSTAVYPALATITAAVSQLTGLSIFHSGLIVIAVARAVLMLTLFLFLEQVIRSSRAAGIGVAIYACNPSFLYFDAQFAYESLALTAAAAVLLIALRWSRHYRSAPVSATVGLAGVLLVLSCGLTLTHHMTSIAVAAFLALWAGTAATTMRSSDARDGAHRVHGPLVPAALLILTSALWLSLLAAPATVSELGGQFSRAFTSVSDLITGASSTKQLFSGAGQGEGLASRVLTVAYILLTLILVFVGLRAMWRGSDRVRDPLWWTLSAVALLYPITLGLRLTLASSEISQRASGFAFLGAAFLAALLTVRSTRVAWRPRALLAARLGLTAMAVLSLIGSFLLGELQATRQPGPYLVGAEDRSVTPEGVAAAAFASAHLPAGSRALLDRTNATLLGSYGGLNPVFGRFGSTSLPRILFSSRFDATDLRALRGQSLAYIVVDRRLAREPPLIGYYVESDEPGAFVRKLPVSANALAKFTSVASLSKVYSNGPIDIYDTRELLR
jgi:hypothetical protein